MSEITVEVHELEKSYSSRKALDRISFQIRAGEVLGLLGPNGAGKTTTVNILSTYIEADGGQATIGGYDLVRDRQAVRSIIGLVPQEIAHYSYLSSLENMHFWGGLYRIPKDALRERTEELLTQLGLWERRNDLVQSLSGGMKRRLNLALGLINRPRFVILDEITVGIDIQTRREIYQLIERLRQQGVALLYTTHHLEEADRLCDRVVILSNGRILAEGRLKEILAARKQAGQAEEALEDLFLELTGSEFRLSQ